MNWGCPHMDKDRCVRTDKKCHPYSKGCILLKSLNNRNKTAPNSTRNNPKKEDKDEK